MKTSRPPDWLMARVKLGEELCSKVGVVLVANVKGKTQPVDDYEGNSIISEFLSGTELDDIIAYFEEANLYCEVLLDEQGFLKWLTTGRPFPRPHCVVYNLAQSGTGPARLTTVAGLCRLYALPLVDSDAYSVAIAQNKFHSLSLLAHFGLPVANCWSFSQRGWWPEAPPMGMRLIAKPTFESASIGIDRESVFTMNESASVALMNRVTRYRQPFTVQEFVSGFELEVPVFEADGPQTLCAIGIELKGQRDLAEQILTYDEVFSDLYSFYNFADQDAVAADAAMMVSRKAFFGLGLSGIGRVDFRVGKDGQPRIMEVNCKPHVTKHSGFLHALGMFECSGIELAKFLVGTTSERYHLAV